MGNVVTLLLFAGVLTKVSDTIQISIKLNEENNTIRSFLILIITWEPNIMRFSIPEIKMCNDHKTHNAISAAHLLKDKEIPLLYFLNVLHLPLNVIRSV